MPSETITTELTRKLGIKVPILLAGMSGVAHADLAAAVSNAGGLGVIGGLTLKPKVLRKVESELLITSVADLLFVVGNCRIEGASERQISSVRSGFSYSSNRWQCKEDKS